jgi:SSS family solute:Na+ symporter/sodium/pantothenate symporter
MAWTLFILYIALTTYLGVLGSRRTKDFSSFAIGDGNLSPIVVGITLAASTASAATFIVNPGFVFVHGLSAFMHLGISVFLGIITMLLLASFKFRKIGKDINAVTIPHWLGLRYKSKAFAIYFSIVNLFSFAFLILLIGGISIVMQQILDISHIMALSIALIVVTTYVIIGGTMAHVFTNMLQGSLMIIVSLIIVVGGVYLMMNTVDFWGQIREINPVLTQWTNPESNLYSDFFSIYISGFLIGAALVCQPHILTKALYVNSDQAVNKYIGVFAIVYLLFTLLLFAGFWALIEVPGNLMIDASTGQFRQDLVMTQYLNVVFPDWLFVIISIVLLAAAMSTMDGLMVGLATITANDLFMNIIAKDKDEASRYKFAHRLSHIILIILSALAFWVSIKPPELLGIFGQFGVYALVLTSLPPLVNGIYFDQPDLKVAWVFSFLAIAFYLFLYFIGPDLLEPTSLAFANPAVPASISIIMTTIPAFLIQLVKQKNKHA